MPLDPSDDLIHVPASPEHWWTETYWFSFDEPTQSVSATFYPIFRTNLGVAALNVAFWSPAGGTPWTAPYYRTTWFNPMSQFVDNELAVAGLRYQVLKPLWEYRVTYDDPGLFAADLHVRGITEPHVPRATQKAGHWDQPCRVEGWVEIHGKRMQIQCHGMRDRSWGLRSDNLSTRASYVYAINQQGSFLLMTLGIGSGRELVTGFVDRDGERGRLVNAQTTVDRDDSHRVRTATIVAEDSLGRTLHTRGQTVNHLAMQATPGMFAWMSMTKWDFCEGSYGQFQDIWSHDHLSRLKRCG